MAKINDGGPAFPQTDRVGDVQQTFGGMSLRDWFAGQAMVGQLAGREHALDAEIAATCAYQFADAMLAARKHPTP